MKLVKNIEDIDANDIMSSVVIDLMQCSYLGFVSGDTKMCPSCKTIQEYLKIFDRIVLVNCDTSNDILQIIRNIDFSKIHLVTVGKINYTPKIGRAHV